MYVITHISEVFVFSHSRLVTFSGTLLMDECISTCFLQSAWRIWLKTSRIVTVNFTLSIEVLCITCKLIKLSMYTHSPSVLRFGSLNINKWCVFIEVLIQAMFSYPKFPPRRPNSLFPYESCRRRSNSFQWGGQMFWPTPPRQRCLDVLA